VPLKTWLGDTQGVCGIVITRGWDEGGNGKRMDSKKNFLCSAAP
jgi:hypothetical protein